MRIHLPVLFLVIFISGRTPDLFAAEVKATRANGMGQNRRSWQEGRQARSRNSGERRVTEEHHREFQVAVSRNRIGANDFPRTDQCQQNLCGTRRGRAVFRPIDQRHLHAL